MVSRSNNRNPGCNIANAWKKNHVWFAIIFLFIFSALIQNSYGQTELQAWGNITGIRVQGELMSFESSLRVVGNQWTSVTATDKEKQSPKFSRDSIGKDVSTHPFIGAVSFHSWRGWETDLLSKWAAASKEINLPLIVAEGSIDAAAWGYPAIFLEQTYILQEINLYIRLMAICQPLSILQWQLTSDYSPLSGGGIFGKEGPLKPTQRFWNLKQLASTPADLNYLPVSCDRLYVTCAALGNNSVGKYAFHIVNNGAERKVVLSGIPEKVHSFKIFTTSKTLSMQEGNAVSVDKGEAKFILPSDCFTTLVSQ